MSSKNHHETLFSVLFSDIRLDLTCCRWLWVAYIMSEKKMVIIWKGYMVMPLIPILIPRVNSCSVAWWSLKCHRHTMKSMIQTCFGIPTCAAAAAALLAM